MEHRVKRIRSGYPLALTLVALAYCAQASELQDAEKELFAGRYANAAKLYAAILKANPAEPDAIYGLVRALIKDHRSNAAYAAAADALGKHPRTTGAQTAAGMAAFRQGEIGKAEEYFRAALKLDSAYAGALAGLASVERTQSRFKTARDLLLAAYRSSPGDPHLMVEYANGLKGEERIKALQQALAILDPASQEALSLRARIADELAIGDRHLRRLTSPYEGSTIKLLQGQTYLGISVQLNGRHAVRLKLDSGAPGLNLFSAAAEGAGLETLGTLGVTGFGVGGGRPPAATLRLASQVQIGDVVFADYPIHVLASTQLPDANCDGYIGTDVFEAFLVTIDFRKLELSLIPYPGEGDPESAGLRDAAAELPAGFYRAYRFGHLLAVPTSVNGGREVLFEIDSGAALDEMDSSVGHEFAKVRGGGGLVVRGIDGSVKVSLADGVSLAFAGLRESGRLLVRSNEGLSDKVGAALAGTIGFSLLKEMVLTIDYRQGAVRLEHKK